MSCRKMSLRGINMKIQDYYKATPIVNTIGESEVFVEELKEVKEYLHELTGVELVLKFVDRGGTRGSKKFSFKGKIINEYLLSTVERSLDNLAQDCKSQLREI